MNVYHVMIDLKDDAKAMAFCHVLQKWMDRLREEGVIGDWRLMRRKLNLASDAHRDFLLEIEVEGLAQLDAAFQFAGSVSDDVEQLYSKVNGMIARADFALYRPFPDPARAERVALL